MRQVILDGYVSNHGFILVRLFKKIRQNESNITRFNERNFVVAQSSKYLPHKEVVYNMDSVNLNDKALGTYAIVCEALCNNSFDPEGSGLEAVPSYP